MVQRQAIITALPPVIGRREIITDNQDTKDIIREVVEAHKIFEKDYDRICNLFDCTTDEILFNELFSFCKKNVRYVIEKDSLQTTRSPAALVAMGYGDCKHYAGFIGGVLDALNRKGNRINWRYRFASYTPFNKTPQHVFVVVKEPGGGEVWIDPVLSELDKRTPYPNFQTDKSPNMLQRISGTPRKNVGAFWNTIADKEQAFAAQLLKSYENGSHYMARIYGNSEAIMNNPPIKFTVDGVPYKLPVPAMYLREAAEKKGSNQFNQVILPPQGLEVVYPAVWKGIPVRTDMLRPVITQDRGGIFVYDGNGTRIFFKGMNPSQTNQELIKNNNHLLDLLVCALGCIQMAFQPYPDAQNLQRFYGNVLNYRDDNFLFARQVKTFAGQLIEGIKKAVQAIGKGWIKFVGIIPRKAFLLLVNLNVANMAKGLDKAITSGKENEVAKKWEGFGGDFGTLKGAINNGKGKPRIFGIDDTHIIGSVEGIGEVTIAAALASAAPIIALLAQFLKSIGDPQTDAIVDSAVAGMNKILTAAGEDPIAVSESIPGGKPVQIPSGTGVITIPPTSQLDKTNKKGLIEWAEENPVLAIGAGAGIVIVGSKFMNRQARRY